MAKSNTKQNNPSNNRGRGGRKSSNYNNKQHGRTTAKGEFIDMETNRDCTKGTPNDVSWYAQNSQMLADSASLAFNQMVGAPFDLNVAIGTGTSGTVQTRTVPGIMTLGWAPSVGASSDPNSAINIAARNLYSYVRHANSGHSNYDPADLMMYILAVDSCYAYHANLVRAYGCMRYYMQTNRYLAKHLLQALGFHYANIEQNLANFRYVINEFALKINSLAVPNSIPFFARHMWMNQHIYMDRPGIKSQLYAYVQNGYCLFTEMKESATIYGSLKFVTTGPAQTVANALNFANSLINPIIGSEAMNIMSGDILKAFGSSGILSVPAIPEDYTVIPEYNLEVLHQMHNFHGLGAIATTDEYITQDPSTGVIIHEPTVARETLPRVIRTKVLDMHVDNPTAADVMVSTRMMGTLGEYVEEALNLHNFKVGACGSEIPCAIRVWRIDGSNGTLSDFTTVNDLDLTDAETILKFSEVTTFDMHPTLYPIMGDNPLIIMGPVGDLDNFVMLDDATLKRMHECALLSELAVPSMGVFNASKQS